MAQYNGKAQTNTISIQNAFSGIDDMWLWNMDKYLATHDLNFFVNGYDGRQKKLPEHLLRPIEEKITEEYFKAAGNTRLETMIRTLAKIESLSTKHEVVSILLERMYKGFGDDEQQQYTRYQYIQALKAHGFKMNAVANVDDDFDALCRISDQLEGIKTKISLLENELKSEGKSESASLNKQLLIISAALQLGYKIDSKKTTVSEWIEMGKLMEEAAKKN